MPDLSDSDVLDMFVYDSESGLLTRRKWTSNKAVGAPVGSPKKDGHLEKALDGYLSAGIAELERERDAAREEVAALRSDANSYQTGYDEGRRMGTKHRQSEVEQLRRDLEALRARVVVIPDRAQHDDGDSEHSDGCVRGFNDCLDELARLNGKAVSEGLLLRCLEAIREHKHLRYVEEIVYELSDALGEGKEHE
ncbi:hypothetical protein IB274_02620 [Pseudomonas sp. PDM18]|uniref:hypothetical protein n=1 Tax=Pseudomonas sp. PDM18 TaxID=2769253 RepID=UPI0017852854|nr:hypothetical protein [Pseudomonas sp. PDM18]MBD9675573.1 hypothetical protein [Pseudomonas sp. PDM18]